MPEEMYPAVEEPAKPEGEVAEPETTETYDESTENEGETALVPKSALGGECKVGETYQMKVVGIYDDEVELAKVKSGDKEPDADDADSKIEAMATDAEE